MMGDTRDGGSIWEQFAGNSRGVHSSSHQKSTFPGETVLITGAGGSIGSAVARFATTCNPETLILRDKQ
jgi:FlaA1/EpsC-like NDP-sugar epimerase